MPDPGDDLDRWSVGAKTGRMSCSGPNFSTLPSAFDNGVGQDTEFKDEFGFTVAQRHEHMLEAIEELYNAWTWLDDAKTMAEQAAAYPKFADAMHDLVSWHPRWDIETGVLTESEDALPVD